MKLRFTAAADADGRGGKGGRNMRGFTLVEMIIVILITAILSAIVAVFLKWPVQAYLDSGSRLNAVENISPLIDLTARHAQNAIPNGVILGTGIDTVAGMAGFTVVQATDSGFYRNGADISGSGTLGMGALCASNNPALPLPPYTNTNVNQGDALAMGSADGCFEVLSQPIRFRTMPPESVPSLSPISQQFQHYFVIPTGKPFTNPTPNLQAALVPQDGVIRLGTGANLPLSPTGSIPTQATMSIPTNVIKTIDNSPARLFTLPATQFPNPWNTKHRFYAVDNVWTNDPRDRWQGGWGVGFCFAGPCLDFVLRMTLYQARSYVTRIPTTGLSNAENNVQTNTAIRNATFTNTLSQIASRSNRTQIGWLAMTFTVPGDNGKEEYSLYYEVPYNNNDGDPKIKRYDQ